jgi:hypothetical protein
VVHVGAEVFDATARPATSAERPRLWQLMTAVFPPYGAMQRTTSREIPVVIVEPIASPETRLLSRSPDLDTGRGRCATKAESSSPVDR